MPFTFYLALLQRRSPNPRRFDPNAHAPRRHSRMPVCSKSIMRVYVTASNKWPAA